MTQNIGIDISAADKGFDRILDAAITRVRRCTAVKNVALQKISGNTKEERQYGFKHLNFIINLQLKSYPRYITNIERFLNETYPIKERISELEPLEVGFFRRRLFNFNKRSILNAIAETEERFISIKRQAEVLQKIVFAQNKLSKATMTGDEEAELRQLLSVEIEKSEELINELQNCRNSLYKFLQGVKLFQISFVRFIEKCMKNKFSNVIDDTQIFCDKLETHISAFYAYKSYIQLGGIMLGFLVPVKEISTAGFIAAGVVFGLDWVVDWVAGLPEMRRMVSRLKGRMTEEEQEQERLKREVIESLKPISAEIPNI